MAAFGPSLDSFKVSTAPLRAIATVFLRHRGNVLLARRAGDRPHYGSRWAAAVTRTIEDGAGADGGGDPLSRARGTLRAAGLGEQASFEGLPFDVVDIRHPDLALRLGNEPKWQVTPFRVHPFLFDVDDGRGADADAATAVADAIAADNADAGGVYDQGCQWVSARELRSRDSVGATVPGLWLAASRVVDPLRWALEPLRPPASGGSPDEDGPRVRCRRLFEDRDHGAAELAAWAADAVGAGADAESVAALRPSMASVVAAARSAGGVAPSGRPLIFMNGSLQPPGVSFEGFGVGAAPPVPVEDVKARLAASAEGAAAALACKLEGMGTVATLSRSSTVLRCLALLGAEGVRLRVLAGRSLPGGEGAATAAAAEAAGHAAELLDDEALLDAVRGGGRAVDAVVLGADSVLLEDGEKGAAAGAVVVNKVGSTALARAAAGKGVPVLVAADRSKVWHDAAGAGVRPPLEDGSLFEVVPGGLVRLVMGDSDDDGWGAQR